MEETVETWEGSMMHGEGKCPFITESGLPEYTERLETDTTDKIKITYQGSPCITIAILIIDVKDCK